MRKKSFILVILYTCFYLAAGAQGDVPEFGKIDIADLKMTECSFDKSASAMNLIKTENITFSINSFTYASRETIEYRRRIKIFDEKGFSNANIVIPYISQNGSVKIDDIEALITALMTMEK